MTKREQDSKLVPISVYATEEEKRAIEKLASMENRSVSNLLKTLALRDAKEKGLIDE